MKLRGIGDRPSERQTRESEWTRVWNYFAGLLVINIMWFVVALLEILLIGRWVGAIVLCVCAIILLLKIALGYDYIEVIGRWKILAAAWFGLILFALSLFDMWLVPFTYQFSENTWVIVGLPWKLVGNWIIWLRIFLIISLPIILYIPSKLLRWVFHMELQVPNWRNTPFAVADPGRNTPTIGRIKALSRGSKNPEPSSPPPRIVYPDVGEMEIDIDETTDL